MRERELEVLCEKLLEVGTANRVGVVNLSDTDDLDL